MSEENKTETIDHTVENDDFYDSKSSETKPNSLTQKTLETNKEERVKSTVDEPDAKLADDSKESDKVDTTVEETTKPKQQEEDIDISSLKDSLLKTKKWGQEKNKKLLAQKRKISSFVSSLVEEGVLDQENTNGFLQSLDLDDEHEEEKEQDVANPYETLKSKLDDEFKVFKKYNRGSDLEEKYQAFYDFFPLLDAKQQEEAMEYIADEEPDVALDYVMTHGEDMYTSLYKGYKEKGSILKYVQHLQNKLNKLEKANTDLRSEVDVTTKKVYNKIDSTTKSEVGENSFFENDYYAD